MQSGRLAAAERWRGEGGGETGVNSCPATVRRAGSSPSRSRSSGGESPVGRCSTPIQTCSGESRRRGRRSGATVGRGSISTLWGRNTLRSKTESTSQTPNSPPRERRVGSAGDVAGARWQPPASAGGYRECKTKPNRDDATRCNRDPKRGGKTKPIRMQQNATFCNIPENTGGFRPVNRRPGRHLSIPTSARCCTAPPDWPRPPTPPPGASECRQISMCHVAHYP